MKRQVVVNILLAAIVGEVAERWFGPAVIPQAILWGLVAGWITEDYLALKTGKM